MSDKFYDIFLNDTAVATVGPSSLKQLHISLGVMNGKPVIKAGGVSDDGELMYINWLEEEVGFNDSLRVVPSMQTEASNPMITRKLGQATESVDEDAVCDFCNREEKETGKLVSFGASPNICVKCVKLCEEALG